MASGAVTGPVALLVVCTHYTGSNVSITVPGPGTIVAYARVWVQLSHTFGATDQALLTVEAAILCVQDEWAGDFVASSSLSNDNYYDSVPIIRSFVVSSAGTYTYGINGKMIQGASAGDEIHKAVLVLVYYPA